MLLTFCGKPTSYQHLAGEQEAVQQGKIAFGLGIAEPEKGLLALYAPSDGVVEKIYGQVDSWYNKGDKILDLSCDLPNAALQEWNLEQLILEQEKSNILVKIKAQQLTINYLQKKVERENAENINKFSAEAKQFDAEYEYRQAQLTQRQLEENLQHFEAQKTLAFAKKRLIQFQKSAYTLRAPADGKLKSLDVLLGTSVLHTQKIGFFAVESPLIVRCELPRLAAEKTNLDQKVILRDLLTHDTLAHAQVSWLSSLVTESELGARTDATEQIRRTHLHIEQPMRRNIVMGTKVECLVVF
jgi:multidrug efflux pump subunit AcrA (membrane-fusion protein)